MTKDIRDVVIVGGGIAGLSAAWRLRHRDLLVLEANTRVGGRIRSELRGPYWLNWGGHVYDGSQGSATQSLLRETGYTSAPVPGNLAGLSMNGKLLLNGPVESFLFRVPMSWRDRTSLVRAGAKVRLAVARYARISKLRPGESEAERQQRVYDFMNDQTFAEFIGDLPLDAESLFKPTVTRSSAEMHEIGAGAGVGYFNLVWNIGAGLSHAINGGPSTLTEGIAGRLGDRVQLGATVLEVVNRPGGVAIRYEQGGTSHEVFAKAVVLATTPSVSHQIGAALARDVRDALGKVKLGPFVSAAFLTNETEPQRWDSTYAIATPKRSFNVILNMSNNVRPLTEKRLPGSSFMTFAPAGLARDLLGRSDEEIRDIFVRDLSEVLPGFADHLTEAEVMRWPEGSPYSFPGRAKLQPVLTRRDSRVMLAGDYLGTQYTESAIRSGFAAADAVEDLVTTEPSRLSDPVSPAAS